MVTVTTDAKDGETVATKIEEEKGGQLSGRASRGECQVWVAALMHATTVSERRSGDAVARRTFIDNTP